MSERDRRARALAAWEDDGGRIDPTARGPGDARPTRWLHQTPTPTSYRPTLDLSSIFGIPVRDSRST